MPAYQLQPQDLLFFRDARPMTSGEGSGGHGARWPEPSLIFDALHAALHRAFPEPKKWERQHWVEVRKERRPEARHQRFGGLRTAGVFPSLKTGEWLFPCPQDVITAEPSEKASCLQPMPIEPALTDLPKPLSLALGNPGKPTKDKPPAWWCKSAIEAYLANAPINGGLISAEALFASEWTTGIGIDADEKKQDGTRIYSAEYLRLRDHVRLGFAASLQAKTGEGLEELFRMSSGATRIVVGGQQRICTMEAVSDKTLAHLLPVSVEIIDRRVKWVLLAPAIFPSLAAKPEKKVPAHSGGWLPNWIDASGRVQLIHDGPGPGKAARLGVSPGKSIKASLKAARIPKPIAITGWTDQIAADQARGADKNFGPRATQLAVPAGTVYYFEADTPEDAKWLADALSWHGTRQSPDFGKDIKNRRSTLLGEKGFGIGVCGNW